MRCEVRIKVHSASRKISGILFSSVLGVSALGVGIAANGLSAATGAPAALAVSQQYQIDYQPEVSYQGRLREDIAALERKSAENALAKIARQQAAARSVAANPVTVAPPTPSPTPSPSPTPVPSTQTPDPQPTPSPAPTSGSGPWPDGALGACIVMAESGGNAQIWNPSGHWGLYQFDAGTWAAYGGDPSLFGNAGAGYQEQIFMNVVAQGNQAIYNAWESDGCPQQFGIY